MKFFFLYNRNETVLDNPDYLILQYYKDEKWFPIEIYKIKGGTMGDKGLLHGRSYRYQAGQGLIFKFTGIFCVRIRILMIFDGCIDILKYRVFH